MASGRALVIGGSLAGLFAGLLLRRAGFEVDIYERVHAELAGRGAGIVTHAMLEEALDAAGIAWRQDLGVDVATRRIYDLSGRLLLEWPYPQCLTAWDRLYDMLRRAFPGEHYHHGKELVGIAESTAGVSTRFSDGSTADGDLLVGADGLRSTVRAHFLPDIAPLYAGYAAWRALVPEDAIPQALHRELFMHMTFCLPAGEQMLGYPVAGPNNDLRPGHRRYNLVWYRPAEQHTQLKRLLTDEAGITHRVSIPPPLISRAVVAEMREAARTALAPQFGELIGLAGQPILQAIYDIESPKMAFGRVAIIGDAAYVARPHVGAGVAKAAQDALALARCLTRAPSIEAGLADMGGEPGPVRPTHHRARPRAGRLFAAESCERCGAAQRGTVPYAGSSAERNGDAGISASRWSGVGFYFFSHSGAVRSTEPGIQTAGLSKR